MTTTTVEVFADITCPFTHVGLHVVTGRIEASGRDVDVRLRAWPLEWVNGVPLDAGATGDKIGVLRSQVTHDCFGGFEQAVWPATTIPAHNLAAMAYARDAATGLAVSLAVRDALFESGLDIGDPAVLADIAENFDLPAPPREALPAVEADYADGQQRGVIGSPHFFVRDHDYFCPALDISRDPEGHLTARFDPTGLADFLLVLDDA